MSVDMAGRVEKLRHEFADVEAQLADPEIYNENSRYTALARRHKELDLVVSCARDLESRTGDLIAAKEMLAEASGSELDEMAEEVAAAGADIERLSQKLRLLLLPKDPNEHRNVIVEIRGAEGGEEANLFARDLFSMYHSYATHIGWKIEVLDAEESDLGGYTTVTFMVKGEGAWTRLKHEAGPHRVLAL